MPNRQFEDDAAYPTYRGNASMVGGEIYEEGISLRPLVRTLWGYRRVMAAAVSVTLLTFLLGSLGWYLWQPSERRASIEFRLEFDGADEGQYPNGLPFSPAEIIASPLLSRVYEANELQRYCDFDQFKNALFILESSEDLELLTSEYLGKFADTRLTPVDRAKLEEEFRQRREALRVPQYRLTFLSPGTFTRIPDELMSKVINDVLATWAEEAAKRKGVLTHQIYVFSPDAPLGEFAQAQNPIIRADILRSRINRIVENIDELLTLPGATVVRAGEHRLSLSDIRANLEDLLRFQLQPLIGLVRAGGLLDDAASTTRYVESRLSGVRQARIEAEGRTKTLQESLQLYMTARGSGATGGRGGNENATAAPGSSAMIPQLGESFLDRLVGMANDSVDTEYRQTLTDRIIQAGQAAVTLDREEAYYADLRTAIGSGSQTRIAQAADGNAVSVRLEEIGAGVRRAVEQMNQVFIEISARNLNPRTILYRVTGPFMVQTARGFTFRTLALYGLLTILVSVTVVPLMCLVHHYFRTDIRPRRTGALGEHRGEETAVEGPLGV
jgi:hypothetical protein